MQWSNQLGVHIKANLVLELYYLMPIITLLGHHTDIYTRKKVNHNSTICYVLLSINFIGYILKIRCMKQAQWAFENVLRGQNGDLFDTFYWNFKELYCMTTHIVQKISVTPFSCDYILCFNPCRPKWHKPYLFARPNPISAIISWIISWQTIFIFLFCTVWFAN